MHLFPERDDHGGRWLLAAALILSLAVHAAGFGVARWWWPQLARAVAKALPRPTPTPEMVALSDAITIEKRTVPRASHRAPAPRPQPRRAPSRPQPRRVAELPEPRPLPVPTYAPIATAPPTRSPTFVPTTEPTLRPQRHGTIHRMVAMAPPRARPTPLPTQPATSRKSMFSPQQLAAMNAQFSRAIAQAQRSLTDVPQQRRPPARMPNQRRYEQVMAGTPEQVLEAEAQCDTPLQTQRQGPYYFVYLRCVVVYSDGFFENVSVPWVQRYTLQTNIFDPRSPRYGGVTRLQPPPDGFVLPEHFALSRVVCSFYHDRCQRIIDAEIRNGGQPATNP